MGRFDSGDWLAIFFLVVLIVVIPLIVVGAIMADNRDAERDEAACRARGMKMTGLIQGSGKTRTTRHVCVSPSGQLYAL